MFENVLNQNAKHTESKKNVPKSFLSRTKLLESVGNAKQSIFYFRPYRFSPLYNIFFWLGWFFMVLFRRLVSGSVGPKPSWPRTPRPRRPFF